MQLRPISVCALFVPLVAVICGAVYLYLPLNAPGGPRRPAYILLPTNLTKYESEPFWISNSRTKVASFDVSSKSCSCIALAGMQETLLPGETIGVRLSTQPRLGENTLTANLRLTWPDSLTSSITLQQVVLGVPRLSVTPDVVSFRDEREKVLFVSVLDEKVEFLEKAPECSMLPTGMFASWHRSESPKRSYGQYWETQWVMTLRTTEDFCPTDSHKMFSQVVIRNSTVGRVSEPFIIAPSRVGITVSPSNLYLEPAIEKRVIVVSHDKVPFTIKLDGISPSKGSADLRGITVNCSSGKKTVHMVRVVLSETPNEGEILVRLKTSHPQNSSVSFKATLARPSK